MPRNNRGRVQDTADAACVAVRHYVAGNVATSIFAGFCVYLALTLLHVPAALLLAVLAGVCDFVPVLGFIVSAVPAILLALTVSTTTAVIVGGVYVAYHMAENYLIGPRVYGGQLRLSNLAVLLAFAVGAELFGIIGALLALPVAAMYPCVEDIWLREYLGRDAVETHRGLREKRNWVPGVPGGARGAKGAKGARVPRVPGVPGVPGCRLSVTGKRAGGDARAGPGPLKVEPADSPVHVEHLADQIQPGAPARGHGGRIDFLERHPSCCRLGIVQMPRGCRSR